MQRRFSQQVSRWFYPAALCMLSICVVISCKKEEAEVRELSTRDKILGTWRRSLRAYDRNGNHRLDTSEVNFSPSAKATDTIILVLVPDATYSRSQVFKGVTNPPENGTWHLQQNDAEIVLQPTTSSSRIDTFRLDTVSQYYFLQHRSVPGDDDYYESYVRPN